MISNRYARANNKYMGEDFDKTKPTKYIKYLEANNLCGWAMCQPLPVEIFEWMGQDDSSKFDNWRDFPCVLEVDLEYPEELHNLHNDYPLTPESFRVKEVEKLIPNLYNKDKCVIRRRNLKQYLDLGLKLTNIHRGIKFDEKPWLKSYIEKNTELRKKARNSFEKDLFKLINNSVFGKKMENIRKRVDVKLVNNRESARKLTVKPNFKHFTIFDENLIAIHMKRIKLTFDKPIYNSRHQQDSDV